MKIISKILLTAILTACCISAASAQTLHALLTATTNDGNIGKGATKNLQNMSNLIQSVIGTLDCEYNIDVFDDPKCTKANVTNWINNLEIAPDDVVFFFYSGHGGRALNDSDPFPQMCMNIPSNQALYMPVAHVEKLIKQKNPRLAIIITECCNSEDPGIKIKPLYAMSTDKYTSASQYNTKALRDLFFNTKGVVKISSSKAKEYSWICNTLEVGGGGLFTNQLIDSFNDAVISRRLSADWNTIFNDIHTKVYALQIPHDGQIYRQEPIAKIYDTQTDDKQIDKGIKNQIGNLDESLQYLVNSSISTENRLAKISEVKKRHFTPDAKVVTIAANGSTIVDYEDVDVFLKRIVLSPYIKRINVLNGSNDSHNTLIKVHEIRK